MTTCLGKSWSFGLSCMSFMNIYHSACASFPFGFKIGMWDLTALVLMIAFPFTWNFSVTFNGYNIFNITGLITLRRILKEGEYELRVDLQDWENETRHAKYQKFSIGDSASNYTLEVLGYSGNAGVVFVIVLLIYVYMFEALCSIFFVLLMSITSDEH